ncbi:hypothetical protein DVH26_18410 [Paenibacillus sp. H1-7]|uniref:DUF6376 family protein n=1 Tax=Paenibacillus sp. H1-7 TaxID=2282849 RepID=UPI001EF8D82F|nr:DUF6376 family protein [Paenibacillus sp. H1-7]ULL16246.1 hypothetical protein DVH26_18410 [Paenibacillus sp. H1-7]
MRVKLLLLLFAVSLLSGCSLLDKVDQSLNYVNEATQFINSGTRLAEQLPNLATQAITDPEARTAIKNEFMEMKARIEAFNKLEPPAFAKSIHEQLLAYNETLTKQINTYLEQMNVGQIDWKSLTDSSLIQTLDQITQILDKLQNLTQ